MLIKNNSSLVKGALLSNQSKTKSILLISVLPLLMLATRADHFGSAVSLPDASLAVFFLAGFYLRRLAGFVLLCVLAAGIDYWAIAVRGASDYCVTSAYGFLLPTYFSVWLAGRWGRSVPLVNSHGCLKLNGWFKLVAGACLSLMVAFLISNGSFYLLSGYFTELSVAEYVGRVALYSPRYLLTPMGYLSVAALYHFLIAQGESSQVEQQL